MHLPSGGKVPVLEMPNHREEIIFESRIVVEFIEDAFCSIGIPLYPDDPIKKAHMKIFMIKFDELTPIYFNILKSFGNDKDMIARLREHLARFNYILEENVDSLFLFDSPQITMADIYSFPHIERMFYFSGSVIDPDGGKFKFSDFGAINKWLNAMKKHEILKDHITDKEFFQKWLKSAKESGQISLVV
jgi:glutathione S-transferase